MIPKKLHYCWFGHGEKPKLAKKCITSWKKYCPDFEIIEWNEDNFDISYNEYTRWCHENGKWAFLSDYARLVIVEKEGGIYLDTDAEIVRPLDSLLKNAAFYGFENDENVATGLGFGAVPHHPSVRSMIGLYDALEQKADGSFPLVVCPELNTKALLPFGLKLNGKEQELESGVSADGLSGGAASQIHIYSAEYFNPYDDPTGRLNKTENTYSIHWYAKSWMSKKTILRSTLTKPLHRSFGTDIFRKRREKRSE